MKFWMNFVVENSNKSPKNEFQRENELSLFTLGVNNTCYLIYPWRKAICFVLSLWYLPNHDVMVYGMECIIKKFSMNRVALTWFRCLELQCGIYLLLNQFFIEFFEKPRLKTILEFESDLIKLILQFWDLKCEQYYWIFG
jgi:hypothetical protein